MNERGFTLIELVVVITVMGVLFIAVQPFIKSSVEVYVTVTRAKDAIQQARIGFQRMMRELSQLEYSWKIDNGQSHAIQFDLPENSNINYRLQDAQITRESVVIIDGAWALDFTYFDESGSSISVGFGLYWPDNVRRIHVYTEVGEDEGNTFTMEAYVSPRNVQFDNYVAD